MKKLFNLFFVLSIALFAVSCGDDNGGGKDGPENDKADLLLGDTWEFQKASVQMGDFKYEMSFSELESFAKEMEGGDVIFYDRYLKFDGDYMTLVNAGEKTRYVYYSNGNFWFEVLDEMNKTKDVSISAKIKALTESQLVFNYTIKSAGITIVEDLYYVR